MIQKKVIQRVIQNRKVFHDSRGLRLAGEEGVGGKKKNREKSHSWKIFLLRLQPLPPLDQSFYLKNFASLKPWRYRLMA